MLTIVWDIDDTLNNLMEGWLVYFNSLKGNISKNINFKYNDLIQNPPQGLLNISKIEYLNSLDFFRYHDYKRLQPNQEILDWFKLNGHKVNNIALTLTPGGYSGIVSNWLFDNFGLWMRQFAFIPSKRHGKQEPIYHLNKAQWLSWFGKADIFIDDSEKNIMEVKLTSGCKHIKTFCVKQPWNIHGTEIKQILKWVDNLILEHDRENI